MRKIKKLISIFLGLFLVFGLTGKVLANKPDEHSFGGQKVDWNLSGAVMPVPPYGSVDIPGSDVSSKLIISQPRCDDKARINGEMRGLTPNTTYTVYLSKGYTKYVDTGWDLTGSYKVMYAVDCGGPNPSLYDMELTGSGGHGGYPSPGPYTYEWNVSDVVITGNTFSFTSTYTVGAVGTIMHMSGTIATDGSLSGIWDDNYAGGRTGTWYTTSGVATKTHTGDMGWPGFFTSTVPAFTFTTNNKGVGEWHLNLAKDDFPGPGTFTLSVWVNEAGGTMLISDNFTLNLSASIGRCWDSMRGRFNHYGNDGDHDSRDFRDFHWKMPFKWFR